MSYYQRVYGALLGVAIGDGMGAPVEGMSPEKIESLFPEHDYRVFLPATHRGDPSTGKGDGRITDDTLMTEALIDAYAAAENHLDAYGFEKWMLPEICDIKRYIPERKEELPLYERLFFPEQYPFFRMRIANAEPRVAGVGNCINCGVAMYMMPIGAVNAGAPYYAYQEAVVFASAHSESYGLEGGAVMAAAYAQAFASATTIAQVINVAKCYAQDGTGLALARCMDVVSPSLPIAEQNQRLRAAVAVHDPRTGHVSDDAPLKIKAAGDIGRPSRLYVAEEIPVALALLAYGEGSLQKTLQAAVRYGRDCDSIASMACGLLGAIYGAEVFPQKLIEASQRENHRNFAALSKKLVDVAALIWKKDQQMLNEHENAMK
ncbi:MAG: ADP-ribosylglycohydrolase family protein [Eubacteriales bacterium]|nr:ADP-ribosylglycohydrolase family protein [Eubacteriales bacterium]